MARNSSRKPSLVSAPIERQARRINRQQKHLERQLVSDMHPVALTGARGRGIRYGDIRKISPMTDTQADFFDGYEDADAHVLYGSAGTGKSFLALYFALQEILTDIPKYDRIIIVRSTVQARDMGFLPGTEEEKLSAYESPYMAICAEITGKSECYEKLKEAGKIEFMSTSFLRGQTFNRAIIISDESQNMGFGEISTIISRTGQDSRLIICGDGAQNDLIRDKHDQSGWREFLGVSRAMVEFRHYKFTSADIVRSGLVKSWIIACEKLGLS